MTAHSGRPVPVPDAFSADFWEATARHELTLARCSVCATFAHPPDLTCAHCGSTTPGYAFAPVSGDGVIRSWTVIRQAFLPGFAEDLPFVLVDVELDAQAELRLIGRLLDGPDSDLQIGQRVELAFEDVAEAISVPAFQLVKQAS